MTIDQFAAALTPIASIVASMVTILLMLQVLRQSKKIGAQGAMIEARQIATHKLVDGVAHDLARAKQGQTDAEIGQAHAEGIHEGEQDQRDRAAAGWTPPGDTFGGAQPDGAQPVTVVNPDPLDVSVISPDPLPVEAKKSSRPRRKPKAPPPSA